MSTPETPRTEPTSGRARPGGDDRTVALPVEGSGWGPSARAVQQPRAQDPSRPHEDGGPDIAARPDGADLPEGSTVPNGARQTDSARLLDGAPRPGTPTTVLPEGGSRRPAPPRPGSSRPARTAERAAARPAGRTRKARLAIKHVDPWSVFVFSLVAALFLAVALVVAVAALYAVLSGLGVITSVNQLYAEVTGGDTGSQLLSVGRLVGGAAVLGAVNVVLLTLLATLGSLLYNLCASFTGGIEVTLGERDQ